MLCELQSVASRFWTRVAVSISYDDNHYTTGTCIYIYIYIYIYYTHTHTHTHDGGSKHSESLPDFRFVTHLRMSLTLEEMSERENSRWIRNSFHISLITKSFMFWKKKIQSPNKKWGCIIHWLRLCRGVTPNNECPGYETKQSDGEVPVILGL